GLSTMRIVVFMIVNVICLLLIKIGWGKEIHSLEQIGLDQYWMGVIAFVFGAKATQSFFESKMAQVTTNRSQSGTDNVNDHAYTSFEIMNYAIDKFHGFFKGMPMFPGKQ